MSDLRKKLTTHLYRAHIRVAPKKHSPDDLWGELFQDVQLRQIYPDSMTFAEMLPAQAQRRVLAAYRKQRQDPHFNLQEFIDEHFQTRLNGDAYVPNPHHSVEQHIEELWDVLRRDLPKDKGALVGLPYPYIVAGGRYAAQFYWDSYFTVVGLAASNRWDMVENMVKNCSFLIGKFGFVPNGNRTYYLTRSQPPVFALMVQLLAEHKGKSVLVRYLPRLLAEYRFWMKGASHLRKEETYARTVRMPSGVVLNRYYDNGTNPRPEGYKEDVALALEAGREPSKVYLDLRAGAESGWDYSSRWLSDNTKLSSIHTTDIVPVDLNSLLCVLEETIADAYDALKQKRLAGRYRDLAAVRATAISMYCWDEKQGFYLDYDIVADKRVNAPTIAGLFPLFAGIAEQEQADRVAAMVYGKFLQSGGVTTSLHQSGQQWDWPNGWAPLQWVTIKGLREYGHNFLADEIKERWINTNLTMYHRKGKMIEKYNVVEPQKPPLNGEYVLQDGFGWTNGVLLALLREDRREKD